MTPIQFTVYGNPAPGGSKNVYFLRDKLKRPIIRKGQPLYKMVDAGKNNAKWKRAVANTARAYMQTEFRDPFNKGVPLKFRMTFNKVRPKSHYGTGKNATTLNKLGQSLPVPTMDPDTTKLLRSTEDALKGIVWYDDNQVVSQSAHKRWGKVAGVTITIELMEDAPCLFPKQ